MAKFKVGDRVVVTKETGYNVMNDNPPGTVRTIARIHCDSDTHFYGEEGGLLSEDEVELVEPKTPDPQSIAWFGTEAEQQRVFQALDEYLRISWNPSPAAYKPKQSIKMKITTAFKKFINADLQAQVKAGYRDEGLTLTAAGQIAAIEALLDASPEAKAAFTTAANEVVAEQDKAA